MPFDALLPAGYPYQGGKVNDITGHTLWLLMQATLRLGLGRDLEAAKPYLEAIGRVEVVSVNDSQAHYIPDLNRGDKYRFKIGGTLGWAEVLILTSTKPLTKAVAFLKALAAQRGEANRGTPVDLSQPDEVIFGLLADLDGNSRGGKVVTNGVYQVNTQQIAAMSISFQVVES